MSCISCGRNKRTDGYSQYRMLDCPPYDSNDMLVINLNDTRKITKTEWKDNTHKILIFTEYQDDILLDSNIKERLINNNIQTFIVSVYNTEPYIDDYVLKTTTYLLPAKLNIMYNGNLKKAIVFVKDDGKTIMNEYLEDMNMNINQYINNIITYINGGGYDSSSQE